MTITPAEISSLDVRAKLAEALELDLVGPWAGHAFADERLPGWVRPSNWYLTGFLIPTGTPPDKRSDENEDEDLDETPVTAGLTEESSEERKSGKKGFFPSSMGISFLVAANVRSLSVTVRWGDYAPREIEGPEGKPLPVWQRTPREESVPVELTGTGEDPHVYDVPGSEGLQLNIVERTVAAEDLEGHLPRGTRSVSVFLVNHRKPDEKESDRAYAFQPELEVRSETPFVARPDLRGVHAEEWDEQVAEGARQICEMSSCCGHACR